MRGQGKEREGRREGGKKRGREGEGREEGLMDGPLQYEFVDPPMG
jgi:hypothetical protein